MFSLIFYFNVKMQYLLWRNGHKISISVGTSDAWSTIHLSHRPSDQPWIYLRLTNFNSRRHDGPHGTSPAFWWLGAIILLNTAFRHPTCVHLYIKNIDVSIVFFTHIIFVKGISLRDNQVIWIWYTRSWPLDITKRKRWIIDLAMLVTFAIWGLNPLVLQLC